MEKCFRFINNPVIFRCYTNIARMVCCVDDLYPGILMSRDMGKVDNSGQPSVLRCSDTSRMDVYQLLSSFLSRFLRVSWVFCFRTCFQQIFLSIFVGMMICSMDFSISDRKEDTYFNTNYWLGVDYDQQEFKPLTESRLCQHYQNTFEMWRWVLWLW